MDKVNSFMFLAHLGPLLIRNGLSLTLVIFPPHSELILSLNTLYPSIALDSVYIGLFWQVFFPPEQPSFIHTEYLFRQIVSFCYRNWFHQGHPGKIEQLHHACSFTWCVCVALMTSSLNLHKPASSECFSGLLMSYSELKEVGLLFCIWCSCQYI